ncbi:unnamed protein product [Rhizoctonia solani]|uniref:BTB domain-containing protein n=1 Tax=Rhizoctonia solani TaxID=456999 RepID=A0A8H3B3Q4_9AGAM|nr:unnamed protein product [Rhizoctonia solani]
MEYEQKYTVVLRGQQFVLTQSQIEFDSPNYFSACFLGDFREAQTRRLELYRNPDIFKIIYEYLCGYEVLPLSDQALPSMSLETGLINLRADALFYQLDNLVKACDDFTKKPANPRSFKVVGFTAWNTRILVDTVPHGISVNKLMGVCPQNQCWATIVTEDVVNRIESLQFPQSFSDFHGLHIVAAVEDYTRRATGNYTKDGWKLIGWYMETIPCQPNTGCDTGILIVLEDLRAQK